jgi:hypothetical protein
LLSYRFTLYVARIHVMLVPGIVAISAMLSSFYVLKVRRHVH